MRKQASSARICVDDPGNLLVELVDTAGHPRQQLQTLITPAPGVRRQREGAELREATLRPQRRAERQPLVKGDRLQTVLDHGAHTNQTDAVRDESSQVARLGIRHPDGRKAIVLEQIEKVPSIAPISFRLPDHHGADLSRLANEDGVTEPVHEGMKPLGVAGGLDPDGHGRPQRSVESLHGITIMDKLLFEDFAGGRVEDGDLLLPRVQITSDECHESGLLFGGRVTVPQPNPINSGRPFS